MNKPNSISLDELKILTIQANDLSEPFNYFLNMAEWLDFIEKHRAIPRTENHETLSAILIAVTNSLSLIINNIKIQDRFFFEAPEYHFFHGTLELHNDPGLIVVFYFSDIQIGLVGYVDRSSKTSLFRFSLDEQQLPHQIH